MIILIRIIDHSGQDHVINLIRIIFSFWSGSCDHLGQNHLIILIRQVKPNKNSKQQALETISKLKETLPIERAQMRMKVLTPVRFNNKIRKHLTKLGASCTVESEEKVEDVMVLVLLVDPGLLSS